jgi:NAD(P)-dependent dehydrogenase (short-subunit alcohol dehydrogenase family)
MSTETKNKATQRIAIVTGGSRGLGRSTAISLASKGVDLIITYHTNHAGAESTVAQIETLGCKAVAFQLDTGNISSFDGFADQVRQSLKTTWDRERFDYLVNNAGAGHNAPFAETKEADFDRLYNVHFKGVYFLTQTLLPFIVDAGKIVNVSSCLARISLPGLSAYGAMKGAVEVLTRYLAKELGPRGIAVNTVAPGGIETDFADGRMRDPEMKKFIASVTAMGRVGLPADIGPMVASLLSDDNRWITGQRIEVSGGMLL